MRSRKSVRAILLLVPYVTVSSILGIAGASAMLGLDLGELFVDLWGSLLGSLVFVLGSVASAIWGYRFARAGRVWLAPLVSLFATALTYDLSAAISLVTSSEGANAAAFMFFWSFLAFYFGWPGVLWGTLAPVVAARVDAWRARRRPTAAPAVFERVG